MSFRWLAIIILHLLMVQNIYAQPTASTPQTPSEATSQSNSVTKSSESTADVKKAPSESTTHSKLDTLIPDTALDTVTELKLPDPPSVKEQLKNLTKMIKDLETERNILRKQVKKSAYTDDQKKLEEDLQGLSQELEDLKISFEELATGGVSLDSITKKADTKFDWQMELQEIIRPLFDSIKRITERPRTIERLRSQQIIYESRLEVANDAIKHLDETLLKIDDPVVIKKISRLQKSWRDEKEDTENHIYRINTQLEQLISPRKKSGQTFTESFQEFASGRGLNIVLTLGGFILTYFLISGIGHLINRALSKRNKSGTHLLGRAILFFMRVLAFIIALLVALLILSSRGDWLLLTLLILFIVWIVWGLRQSLPRFVKEINILLGIGSIRESERIVYGGLPYCIKVLNVYCILKNPFLKSSTLRLPLHQIIDLYSRPSAPGELWFPSRKDDFVILDGDIFGKVLSQTSETVYLQVVGSVKTYSTTDYLSMNPRNLSLDGFAMPVVFGLGYCHQDEILDKIVPQLHAFLTEELEQQPFYPHMKALMVEFNEAAASSLNLLIVASFTGEAAGDYWAIRRFLQRSAVKACNKYDWEIPFDQLTVHMAPVQF